MNGSENEKLVASINESSQHISAVTLTFLAVCVYIGVTVASTTHEVLLRGKNIALPLFSVEVPLSRFYAFAPTLLVFLHLHLLFLLYLLQCKVERYTQEDNPPEQETDLFFASLPLSIILLSEDHPKLIRFSLRLLLPAATMALPILLLIATQIIFLPYHSPSITKWHAVLTFLDVLVVWYFALRTPGHLLAGTQKHPLASRLVIVAIFLILSLFSIGLSFIAIRGLSPGRIGDLHILTRGVFSQNLLLADRELLSEAPSGEDRSPKNVNGLSLAGRDLRGADFSGAVLINADFRGSDLTDANFTGSDLRGAKFSKFGETPTVLHGANFKKARLEGINLSSVNLLHVNLEEADLHGATLSQADLRGAILKNADLRGADLSSAHLTGAYLFRAMLQGAKLNHADLKGAKLVEADAIATDFSHAETFGADFRNAHLYLANDLIIDGADLSGARLGIVIPSCGAGNLRSPKSSDLRHIDFHPLPAEAWEGLLEPLRAKEKEDPVYAHVLNKIETRLHARKPMLCLSTLEKSFEVNQNVLVQIKESSLLYDESQLTGPMKNWPHPALGEDEYYAKLAGILVIKACNDPELAEALVNDLSGESPPERPIFSRAVARKMSDQLKADSVCSGLSSLSESLKTAIEKAAKKDPLRTDDFR
jgi:uncharacterized protein YjbI with pentapeptide repeats